MKEKLLRDSISIVSNALVKIQIAKTAIAVFEEGKNWKRAERIGDRNTFDDRFFLKFSFLTFNHSHFAYQSSNATDKVNTLVTDGHRAILEYIRTVDANLVNKEYTDKKAEPAKLSVDGILYAALSGFHYAEVELEEAKKASDVFAESTNWNSKEDSGRQCSYFSFNGLDPCGIAYRGLEHLNKAAEILRKLEWSLNQWVYESKLGVKSLAQGNA